MIIAKAKYSLPTYWCKSILFLYYCQRSKLFYNCQGNSRHVHLACRLCQPNKVPSMYIQHLLISFLTEADLSLLEPKFNASRPDVTTMTVMQLLTGIRAQANEAKQKKTTLCLNCSKTVLAVSYFYPCRIQADAFIDF